jgi:Winged helix DNA-binding domain
MDVAKLRAWYWHRQGLDGRLEGSTAAQVIEETGWIRSLGSPTAYLGLYARSGISRANVDAAVARLEIHELPVVRGCTYVLPKSDFALGLGAGGLTPDSELKTAAKLGVTEKEITKLCEAVKKALETGAGALDPEQIRQGVGTAARSLGEEGKKKGLSTTLPLALGQLQGRGEIRRVPVDGRLDQQRFRYTLWRPNPLAKFQMAAEEVHLELARRYFKWIGPATLAQFQAFAGITVKAAKAAAAAAGLVPIKKGAEGLVLAEDVEKFRAFQTPKTPQYALVGSIDGIALFRRDLGSLMDAPDAGKGVARGDLPRHAILDRGRVVGLWDYDAKKQSIEWTPFIKKNHEMERAVARTEAFVRDELGSARS